MVAAAAARFGAALPGRAGGGRRRARTSRPGPGPPAAPSCRPDVATGHTMDDQAETILRQPAAGRRRPTGWPACAPGPRHPLLGAAPARDPRRCAPTLGLAPVRRPDQRRPAPSCATGSATSCCRCCADVAGRDLVPGAGPPGRRAARRGDADLLDAPRPAARPRPTPRALAAAPPAAGPPGACGAGCADAGRAPPARRWPRSSGCWPWPGGERSGHRAGRRPAGARSAGRWRRPPRSAPGRRGRAPVVSRR